MTFDSRAFRDTLGCFATGVCVVTASCSDQETMGMTVNSFTSVSLEPPLVLWCLGKSSQNGDHFLKADHYTINILNSEQESLSNYYASRDRSITAATELLKGNNGHTIIKEAMAFMDCTLVDKIEAGDHWIMLGRVENFGKNPDKKPLLFAQGRYATL